VFELGPAGPSTNTLLPGAALYSYSYIQAEQVRVPVFGVSPSSAVPSARATSKLASRVLRGGAAARIGCTIQCTRGGAGARRIGTRGQARIVRQQEDRGSRDENSRDGGVSGAGKTTKSKELEQELLCTLLQTSAGGGGTEAGQGACTVRGGVGVGALGKCKAQGRVPRPGAQARCPG
jgi:hypothetical protein